MADDTIALGQAEIVLDRWLKDLEAGGDKAELSYAAVMALAEAGAPPEMTRDLARLACIAVHDKKINQAGWSERELALFNAARAMLVANIRPENILPLLEAQRDLRKPKGKKPRKFSHSLALSTFAAAVTALKEGSTVDAAIAEVATPNGISRKDIKNYRDRLNRGLVNDASYRVMVATFRGLTREQIISYLSRTAERFCT